MKNVKKLLFATVLVAAALASAPVKVQAADPWCTSCEASGFTDCYSCCRCDGGTGPQCVRACL